MNNWLTYTLEERKVMLQTASAKEKLRKKCRVFLTGEFVAELKDKLNGVGLSDGNYPYQPDKRIAVLHQ